MIVGSELLRYLLSVGGAFAFLFAVALWVWFRPGSRTARRVLLAGTAIFVAISTFGPEYLVARAISAGFKPFQASDAAAGRRTAVVVLGSGGFDVEDWSGRIYSVVDHAAAGRVLEAARVFRLIDPAFVISSGGNSHDDSEKTPTGETMRQALLVVGVPAERLLVETSSKTTRDEAVVIASIIQAQSIDQLVVVTSQTHMRRAIGTFRAAGVSAIPAIAQEFDRPRSVLEWIMPTGAGLELAAVNAHETVGLIYYALRGWWRR